MRHDRLLAVGSFLSFAESELLPQNMFLETIEEGWWYCAILPDNLMTVTLFTDPDICRKGHLQKAGNWRRLINKTTHLKDKVGHTTSCQDIRTKNAFSQICNFSNKNNFLAVGDAAVFDPASSMGIGFAVSSGYHVVNVLTEHLAESQDVISSCQNNIGNNYKSVKAQL